MSDPITNPSGRDFFLLDGKVRSPGVCKIKSGGGPSVEIQDMGQLLTLGKNTIVRAMNNIEVVYEIRLWEPADFAAWNGFEAMLYEGMARYPFPRSYVHGDLRAPRLTKSICKDIGPEMIIARGGPWAHDVTFHQWQRIKPAGGAVRPPLTQAQRDIRDTSAENKTLDGQLEAMKAAARKGK